MATRDDRWRVALLAGGLWLLVDVLRMWTPSLITIFGRAAETPPELIGAFALACGAAPLLLLLALPRTDSTARIALVLLLAARVALTVTDGGRPQLVLGSLGTVAGLWWLALACGRNAGVLVPGLAWGLLFSTTAHAALGTYGAVWRRDVAGIVVLLLAVALVVLALAKAGDGPGEAPGRRAGWLVLPVLLLCGVLFANAGRASAMAGTAGLLACVGGTLLAVGLASRLSGRVTVAVAALVLVAVTAVGALIPVSYDGLSSSSPWLEVPVFLLGTPAALVLLGATVSPASESRRGGPFAVAGGAVLWVVLLFVYYAGYDLGYRADVVLVALAVVVAVVALTAGHAPVGPAYHPSTAALSGVAVVTLVLAAVGPTVTLRPVDHDHGTGDRLRVVAYNLRMGYGIDGRFDQRAVAELLGRQHADVILLSEIDRGWLLNGGQDHLRILARLLDMEAAFGPAADQVWGDAVLSTHALRDIRSRALDRDGAVTGAQALSVRLTWHGQPVTVISTHLQPGSDGTDDTVSQASELADLMTTAYDEGGVVVAGGDLNTTPGSKAWERLLATGFSDALADARPLRTASADSPEEEIDHLFASPGVTAENPRALDTRLSDHLPVLVDLQLPQ
ncbi:MAG: endonuclease/exonuclease/phosphatase family protein [Aeromicrobium sp.]